MDAAGGPVRILHAYAGPFPTHQGTQVYLRGLLQAQLDRGHTVALRCWAAGAGGVPEGLDVRRLPALPGGDPLRSGPHPSRAPRLALLLAALRRDLREDWDIVHAHHVEATLALRTLGARPLVVTPHTALADELPTYLPRGRRLLGRVGARLDRRVARSGDLLLALSAHGAEALHRLGARRVLELPPGVEPLQADVERGRARLGGLVDPVVYTGNTDAYQDLPVLLRAVARYHLPLVVVTGSDPAPLRALARVHGVRDRDLGIVATTDFRDTRDIIAASAVGAIPRTTCAGFPMKALNVLGLGLPLVAVRGVVDLPGVVHVSPGDVDDLGRALAHLRLDPAARRELGAAGRCAVRRQLSWEAVATRLDIELTKIARTPVAGGTVGVRAHSR